MKRSLEVSLETLEDSGRIDMTIDDEAWDCLQDVLAYAREKFDEEHQ